MTAESVGAEALRIDPRDRGTEAPRTDPMPSAASTDPIENAPGADRLREQMIAVARRFSDRIASDDIVFIGVCGSVSYTPNPGDDIDLVIVCRNGTLWRSLLRCFFAQRRAKVPELCLSLTMDEDGACRLFDASHDYLTASDAAHVIPLRGGDWYERLLRRSPSVFEYFPERRVPGVEPLPDPRAVRAPLDAALFFLTAAYLEAKALVKNHQYRRRGWRERVFRTVVSPHQFWFDSERYRQLRMAGRPAPAAVPR